MKLIYAVVIINIILILFNVMDIVINREFKNNLFEITVLSQLNAILLGVGNGNDRN